MKKLLPAAFFLLGVWALAQQIYNPGSILRNQFQKGASQKAPAAKSGTKSAAAGPKTALDKKVLADYVRHLVPYPDQVNVEVSDPRPSTVPGLKEVTVKASLGNVSEEKVYYVSDNGQKILTASVFDVTQNPFKPQLDMLKTALQPSLGTPGAPVVLVMFSDFQCPYCRDEAKELRANLLKTYPSEVRLYFKDFPLTQIHPWAKEAAVGGRCIFGEKPEAFWDYFDWIYENQATIDEKNLKEKTGEFLKSHQLDTDKINACITGKQAMADVEREMAEGRALGVNSTPTLFVNGRMIPGSIRWENLQQLVDIEIGYQRREKNAGEQCCTVTLDPLGGAGVPK